MQSNDIATGTGSVAAVAAGSAHGVDKPCRAEILLLPGLGVSGDAHFGATVQHRSRVARDPAQPNLRQVHLLHAELFEELEAGGIVVGPGRMGENVTTRGIDLLGLPTGSRLHLGAEAVVEITGLRNPCHQLDEIAPGLLRSVLDRDASGALVRKAGVMAVVLAGGTVRPGDSVRVQPLLPPHAPLQPV